MNLVVLKLLVTPPVILAASLTGRRWGELVGGWFVGLPLTSGPVCLFLALEQGRSFAASSALGSIAGVAAEAAFCFAYGITARRGGWAAAIGAGSVAFLAAATLFALARLSLWPLVAIAVLALAGALVSLPRIAEPGFALPARPAWDIPARMTIATSLVIGLTQLAPLLGPRLSGLSATYPIFATVLAAFAHATRGPAAAIAVLRGLMTGLLGFTAFFVVLNQAIEQLGIAAAFLCATGTALAIQAVSFWAMRRARSARAIDQDHASPRIGEPDL